MLEMVLATAAAGVGSVWLAAALMQLGLKGAGLQPLPQHLLSLAAGALLATAFMHLLPEALEGSVPARPLLASLLAGVVFFFLLDKAELWHHGHEHHQHHADTAHHHSHAHAHSGAVRGWALLTGDSVHCFGDGVLVASAFLVDERLGWVAALAVLTHEVPHHMGDLAVLSQGLGGRRAALLKVSLAGAITPLGGLCGWWLLAHLQGLLPYVITLAASSFVYVALADLIPQLQRRLGLRETFKQVAWLLLGIGLVVAVGSLLSPHSHP